MFERVRLIEIPRNFICYSDEAKILAAYHQFFAVRKAVLLTVEATRSGGKGGVFWHTQGSGKSLSMVFYAKMLQRSISSPTFIGFTGTPISSKDRSTREVFGDYIDVYDMTQAVEDGATRPVFYESRVVNVIVYCDLTAELKEMFAPLNPIYMSYYGGFSK